ncbi:MAG: zinc-dependent alcohol dehydrogenase [Christensenellales bacterium]|jgi:L-iditol 2-dehydrogenase
MRALVKYEKGPGNIKVMDMPEPVLPAEDWVIIKVKAAGVCGTDIHILHDEYPYWPPVILGHEFSGIIEQVGSKCSRFKVGDAVVAEPHSLACGVCELCRTGRIQLCPSKRSPGWGIHGAFAEYVAMPEMLLHKIPEGISFDMAALTEPLAIAVHQVSERCGIGCQDFVAVSGAGPIGILAAFVAKASGAGKVAITGMDACEYIRFDAARALGADYIINVQKEDPVAKINELTDGKGADVVIETSGADAGIAASINMVKRYGKLCAIGMGGAPKSNVPWNTAVLKSIDVAFCMSSSYTSWDKALSLMASTGDALNAVITHRADISEWEKVFAELQAERGIKALFIP